MNDIGHDGNDSTNILAFGPWSCSELPVTRAVPKALTLVTMEKSKK